MGPLTNNRSGATRPMRRRVPTLPRTQGGFMLIVALIIMIIMTLSSIAMVVSLRGGISASANIAFRQAATRTADVAVDTAYQWVANQILSVSATALNNNLAPATTAAATTTPRYYATMNGADSGCKKDGAADAFTPTSYRFSDTITGADGFPCAGRVPGNPAGYTLYYVVHRMANTTETACLAAGGSAGCGTCPTAGCIAPAVSATSSSQTGSSQDATAAILSSSSSTNSAVYYRITVKVAGPRQNNRYIQGFIF